MVPYMFRKPSDIHPSLADEHIDFIGHLIARVRAENLDSADERDTGWSLGCRAYAWCCTELVALSKTEPWIAIVDSSLKFIFKIGNVEISFYKGPSAKPNKNIYNRAQSYPEIRQLSLLSNSTIPERLIWAYAVETDTEGLTTNIEFFGMSEAGDVIASRTVPLHAVAGNLVAINAESAPAELAPAPVSLPKLKHRKAENDESQEDDH